MTGDLLADLNLDTLTTLTRESASAEAPLLPLVQVEMFTKPVDFDGYRTTLRTNHGGFILWQNVDIRSDDWIAASNSGPLAAVSLLDSHISNAINSLQMRCDAIDDLCPRCRGGDRRNECRECAGTGRFPEKLKPQFGIAA